MPPRSTHGPRAESLVLQAQAEKEKDFDRLMAEIRDAGAGICSMKTVRLDPDFIKVRHRKGFRICVMCGEAYPLTDGAICRGCQGDAPFVPLETPLAEAAADQPDFIHVVPVEDAVGMHALNDMTRIIPGRKRDRPSARPSTDGRRRLSSAANGRGKVYTVDHTNPTSAWIH